MPLFFLSLPRLAPRVKNEFDYYCYKFKYLKMKKLVLFLLALLGFSSVYSQNEENRPMMKYGVPRAAFHLKGKVTNAKGRPVKDAQVTVKNEENGSSDVFITDRKGKFEYNATIFPKEFTFQVEVADVDGKKNKGDFETQTKEVKINKEDYKTTDDPWNRGDVIKEETFILEKKNNK